jgi:hypothetical protein
MRAMPYGVARASRQHRRSCYAFAAAAAMLRSAIYARYATPRELRDAADIFDAYAFFCFSIFITFSLLIITTLSRRFAFRFDYAPMQRLPKDGASEEAHVQR